MSISLKNITKKYGELRVFEDFSLNLPEKGVITLYGPSGGGKTTLLHMIAGLEKPDSGIIEGLSDKRVSLVFQEDRLLPWHTVMQNIILVADKSRIDEAMAYLKLMELEETKEKYPQTLSGGMKRRVALIRSLIYGGAVYLWDEPFKGLDAAIKQKIMDHVKILSKSSLIILVTHDQSEAEYLSDRIIELAGSPLRVVDNK